MAQLRFDVGLLRDGPSSPFDTVILPDPGSTDQTSRSPGSKSRIAATGSGTVVRMDSDRLSDRTALDSNRLTIGSPLTLQAGRLKDYGLDVGLPVGNAKYASVVGQHRGHQLGRPTRPAELRARGLAIAARKGAVSQGADAETFVVIDIWDNRRLLVTGQASKWVCSCVPPATAPACRCEHVWAVLFVIEARGSPEALAKPRHRKSYPQPDWHAYREGQQGENRWFDRVALALLETIEEPIRLPGRPGRPRTPIREALFITLTKVHEGESLSVVHGRLDGLAAQGKVSGTTNYTLPARTLGREDLTPILTQLVRDSAKPMVPFERGGTLAIDSTGFTTSVFGAYLTETHEPDRRHEFVKAHVGVGTRTHIITDVVVTDQNHADSPEFAGIVERTMASGFQFSRVVADKGYLARHNYRIGSDLGLEVYIDFRSNVGPKPKGVPSWREAWYLKHDQPEEFGRRYHARSNVESTFSSIKRRRGESLFSRSPVSRRNELLCKILVHNVTVLIQQLFEREVDPETLFGDGQSGAGAFSPAVVELGWGTSPREKIDLAVKESNQPEG